MKGTKSFFAALFALAWILAPAAAQTAGSDPKSIVEQIYKISAGKDGKYQGTSAFHQKPLQNRWFSKGLLAALKQVDAYSKKTGDIGLDFDPVTNSQDPSVNRLTIDNESTGAAKSIVSAKFFVETAKEPDNIRYIFVREGNAWKLDDMTGDRGGKDRWVLRNILKEIVKGR
jgi:hypothetical protein